MRRIVRGIASRTVAPKRIVLWQAGPQCEPQSIPAGFNPLRIGGSNCDSEAVARRAMQAVNDDGDTQVGERLSHGHELFGWQSPAGSIACFGWVCFHDRAIGAQRLYDSPGRAFIYNCHTLPAFRGRGLYTALLRYVRSTLAAEAITDFIIDANTYNVASIRGIERAGFRPIASVTSVRLLRRWDCVISRRVHDPSARPVFVG